MRAFILPTIFILLFSLVVSGCTAFVARQELEDFRRSFLEAQRAGDLLYDEISAIMGRDEAASRCQPRSGVARCFDPTQVSEETQRNEDASVRARRLALALVSEYTLGLVDLADGKSAGEVRANVGRIAALGQSLISVANISGGGLGALLTGPALATVTDLAGNFEAARSGEAARQSLVASQETIAQLIDVLIADTSSMYNVFLADRQVRAAESGNVSILAEATEYHEALAAYVLILRQAKASHGRLIQASGKRIGDLDDLRASIEEAIKFKNSAQTFWSAIRDVRN